MTLIKCCSRFARLFYPMLKIHLLLLFRGYHKTAKFLVIKPLQLYIFETTINNLSSITFLWESNMRMESISLFNKMWPLPTELWIKLEIILKFMTVLPINTTKFAFKTSQSLAIHFRKTLPLKFRVAIEKMGFYTK